MLQTASRPGVEGQNLLAGHGCLGLSLRPVKQVGWYSKLLRWQAEEALQPDDVAKFDAFVLVSAQLCCSNMQWHRMWGCILRWYDIILYMIIIIWYVCVCNYNIMILSILLYCLHCNCFAMGANWLQQTSKVRSLAESWEMSSRTKTDPTGVTTVHRRFVWGPKSAQVF